MQIICKIINSVGCPRHLTIASKLLRIKTYLGGVFWVFRDILALFHIYEQRKGFWAENQIFKNFSKSLKTCWVGVFWVFHGVFSIIRHLSREPDFFSQESDFQKFLKMPQSVFSWCFLSVSKYFLALFDIWVENRIFKKFFKSLKTCSVCVFWVFRGIFSTVPHLWAENRILSRKPDFQKFLKKPQNMFSWCFLSVPRYLSIVRNLSREPDFSAENRIFKNFSKILKTCLVGVFWVFQVF